MGKPAYLRHSSYAVSLTGLEGNCHMHPILIPALLLSLLAPANAVISATANGFSAGLAWGLGNRMEPAVLPPWAIRLQRSHANLMENLPSFLGVTLVAALNGTESHLAVCAAWAFVMLRVAFAVTYTVGITVLRIRTLVYFASLGALIVIALPMLREAWELVARHP